MSLLFGHDGAVSKWAADKFKHSIAYLNAAVGVINRDGVLVGAALFQCSNGSNVEFSYFGAGSITPSIVRGLMRFAFDHLKVARVTAKTPRKHRLVIRALPKFGFKMEGVMRHYYGPKKKMDAIVFGLVAADARRFIGEAR